MSVLDYALSRLMGQERLAEMQRRNLELQGQNNQAFVQGIGNAANQLLPAAIGAYDKYDQNRVAAAQNSALAAAQSDPSLNKLSIAVKPSEEGVIRDETGKVIGADPDSPNVKQMLQNGGSPITRRAAQTPEEIAGASFEETPDQAADRILSSSASGLSDYQRQQLRSNLINHIAGERQTFKQQALQNAINIGKEGRENAIAGSTIAKNFSDVGKNQADVSKMQAEAVKIPVDVQSTRGKVIGENIDKARIAQILKLPASQQDSAFEQLAQATAGSLGEGYDPQQVRNQIGASAYGIADEAQKTQLGNTHFWAQLAETQRHNKEDETAAQNRVGLEAERVGIEGQRAAKEEKLSPAVQEKVGSLQGSITNIDKAQKAIDDWRKVNPHSDVPGLEVGKTLLNKGANALGTTIDPQRDALALRIKSIAIGALHAMEGRVDPNSLKAFTEKVNIASDPEQLRDVLDQIKDAAKSEIQGQLSTQQALGHNIGQLGQLTGMTPSADEFVAGLK